MTVGIALQLYMFDGTDREQLQRDILEHRRYYLNDLAAALSEPPAGIPPRFSSLLLRHLGSPFYSVSALTLAHLVGELVEEKEDLRKAVEEQKRLLKAATEERKRFEKEQRSMAPALAKAIRAAFDKARREAVETLGQVTVFKALIDETTERASTPPVAGGPTPVPHERLPKTGPSRPPRASTASSVVEALQSLGITPKWAAALHAVGQLAHQSGLILLIEGLPARLAAEAWLMEAPSAGRVLDCPIGLTDDNDVRDLLTSETGIAILDANLSPIDVYARPLIDAVQQRIVNGNEPAFTAPVVMSLSGGVAALPIPPVLESISLRVGLDHVPVFIGDADARDKLEAITASDLPDGWVARLWRPAAIRLFALLQGLPPEDLALAMSVLDAGQVQSTE